MGILHVAVQVLDIYTDDTYRMSSVTLGLGQYKANTTTAAPAPLSLGIISMQTTTVLHSPSVFFHFSILSLAHSFFHQILWTT